MTLKSKGFTLIELLIVIIIIGILAGMMMLSVGSATDKAKATEIVSNMKTLRSAVSMYEMDHGLIPEEDTAVNIDSFDQYLDRKITDSDNNYYITNNGTDLYIAYDKQYLSSSLKKQLDIVAEKAGINITDIANTLYYRIRRYHN